LRRLEARTSSSGAGLVVFGCDLREKVKEDLGQDTGEFDLLPFADLDESVRQDIEFLEGTHLLNPDTLIRGFVYDVRTGRLREVKVEAGAEAGRGR